MAAFLDRIDAGRQLASFLTALRDDATVVIGIARGGIPVAAQVARSLDVPLDVLVVCRIAAVGQPQVTVGAVAETGALYLDPDALQAGESPADITGAVDEIERRVHACRGARSFIDVAGRPVIVVDDGVATGATLRAAVRALRRKQAARVVVAAPVIPQPAAAALREEADAVVCIAQPWGVRAIGGWYQDFTPVSDAEVTEWLAAARRAPAGASHA